MMLFLTSKVRLHCDPVMTPRMVVMIPLFLTSKVRLHCDDSIEGFESWYQKRRFS